jgi:hypothetical protein
VLWWLPIKFFTVIIAGFTELILSNDEGEGH